MTAQSMDPNEADLLRGHPFLPDDVEAIPRLYATENTPAPFKVVHLHYFVGACDWWIAELGEDRRVAFGYVNLGDPQNAEWGYVDLNELRSVAVRHPAGFTLAVERDLHFRPTRFADLPIS